MREIKFKCYCLDNYFGKHKDCIVYNQGHINYIDFKFNTINCDGDVFDINNEDVFIAQYTGLKDKNGKEIYEGDIVDCGDIHEVFWNESDLDWSLDIGKEGLTAYSLFQFRDDIEIIGNIHENPELLEVSK
jgi:uncharacterized phage protein (TIGR01671 family)